MSIWRLVVREILHRKVMFLLGVVSVLVAVGVLVAELAVLDGHEVRTRQILADLHDANVAALAKVQRDQLAKLEAVQADQVAEFQKVQAEQLTALRDMQARHREQLAAMQDDYRKITKSMGFNVLILPKDQDLAEFHQAGRATATMPEEYVTKLANSKIVTVQHLFPILQSQLAWPERGGLMVTVIGTRGEVPLTHRDPKEPMVQPVKEGQIVIGYEIHKRLGIQRGDKIKLKGGEFTVSQVHTERGSRHDYTLWVPLAKAQEMFEQPGRINAIQALECSCAFADVEKIRKEIGAILPRTQVLEMASMAKARADARERAKLTQAQAVENQKLVMARAIADQKSIMARAIEDQTSAMTQAVADQTAANARAVVEQTTRRAQLGDQRKALAMWLIPTVIAGCAVWIGLLAYMNVRQRRTEIGLFRAIGVPRGSVLAVFLIRAVVVGALGALLGYGGGFVLGGLAGEVGFRTGGGGLFHPAILAAVLVAAPLLAALASAAPAIIASQQDPALVLSQE